MERERFFLVAGVNERRLNSQAMVFKQEYLNNNIKAEKFIDWKERFDNRDNCELGKINFVFQFEW